MILTTKNKVGVKHVELVYSGKTKDVYACNDGNYVLKFKDDVTGTDGIFDPGANTVGLTIEGAGTAGLALTKYFFELLSGKGIPTHYIAADIEKAEMKVKPAIPFGHGLEVICRFRAVGSFFRRYKSYVKEGQALDGFVEITIKDDESGDPPISKEALEIFGVLTVAEYDIITKLTKRISEIVRDELAKKGIELYDIKLEFGKTRDSGEIMLIDEISGGNMRAFKDGKFIQPLELTELVLNRS